MFTSQYRSLTGLTVFVINALVSTNALATEAGDEVIVTATRLATPAERIGSSVSVITSADIERRQYQSVSDALKSVPSLGVIHSGGGIGKLTNLFSRGSETNHTLVLLDGIELNDPSNTDGLIDLSHIYIKDVERIEVVMGPQSTLYGSDAMGAVIQIFTKQGGSEAVTNLEVEAGSFNTFNQYAGTRGSAGAFTYAASLQHTDTDGVSALSDRFRQPNGVLDDDRHGITTPAPASVTPPARHYALICLRVIYTPKTILISTTVMPPTIPTAPVMPINCSWDSTPI